MGAAKSYRTDSPAEGLEGLDLLHPADAFDPLVSMTPTHLLS